MYVTLSPARRNTAVKVMYRRTYRKWMLDGLPRIWYYQYLSALMVPQSPVQYLNLMVI